MIKLIDVSKNFFNRKLFEKVNMEISSNQLTCIVGQSGSGKTTLLNIIAGLENPSIGRIILETNGKIIDLQRNNNLGLIDFVFQDYNLFPNFNVLDNLKIGRKIVGKSWDKKETVKTLNDFDIDESILKSKISELSGGEQQRISILRALERDSKILLVDEPTGNLDEESAKKVFETLKKVSKTRTVIMVTHDLESAQKYADSIYEIKNESINLIKKSTAELVVSENIEKTKKEKSFLNKVSLVPTFVLSNFKKHKISFILFSVLVFFMMIFSFASSSMGLFVINPQKVTALNLDTIKINNREKTPFTSKDDEFFKKTPYLITEVDQKYVSNDSDVFFDGKLIKPQEPTTDNLTNNVALRYESIPTTEFFEKRLKSIGILGEPITGDNQIVLGKPFVDKINGTNLIGKNVVIDFKIDGISPKTLKVVGINNNLDFLGRYISYISSNVLLEPRETRNYVSFAPFSSADKVPETLKKQALPTQITGNEQMVLGSNENNLESLLISTKLSQLWKAQGVNLNLDSMFKLNYYKDVGTELKVTGIFTSDKPEIRLNQATIEALTNPPVQQKILYLKPNYDFNTIHRYYRLDSSLAPKYSTDFGYSEFLTKHVKINDYYLGIIVILSIVFILINVISLITFPIIIAKLKKKEIATLKLLGAKFWQLVVYNVGTFVTILVVLLGLFVIASAILLAVLYHSYVTSSDIIIDYSRVALSIIIPWVSILIIGTAIFGLSSFFVQLSSYKKIKSF